MRTSVRTMRAGVGGMSVLAALGLVLTGCPPTDDVPDAASVIDFCSSGLTPGAACSFTMPCTEYIDFIDGGCGTIETSCVAGRVVVDDRTFACSLPDASVEPPLPDASVDAPEGFDASCDEGRVSCGSPASVCCAGVVRTFFDGPCFPRSDGGMPTLPDCAADPFEAGCPCTTDGEQGCPRGSRGLILSRWATICRGGVYVEQSSQICCGS